ncbi:hypothetical protein MKX01_004316 [Papaver californicum]|nr:hypothetical protein MKX01_004316 [Papaver californicum]
MTNNIYQLRVFEAFLFSKHVLQFNNETILSSMNDFVQLQATFVAQNDVKFAFKMARNAIDSHITNSGECSTSRTMKETCNICLEDISVRQFFTVQSCSHRYCCSCMRMVPRCLYDGCKTMLNLDNYKQFMTSKLIDMMSKRIKEDSIPVTEKVYCPNPKCSNLMSKTNIPKCDYNQSTNEYLRGKCMKCDGYFCFKCKVPWHNGMTCEAYQAQKSSEDDAKLKNLAETKLWRQCKKCNHMIELVWGCYHITCRCGHEFCYTCGAVWINKTPSGTKPT